MSEEHYRKVVLLSESTYSEKLASSWEVSDIEKLAGTEEGVYLEFKKPSEFVHAGRFAPDRCSAELSETVWWWYYAEGEQRFDELKQRFQVG